MENKLESNLFDAIEQKSMYEPADFDTSAVNEEEHLVYDDHAVSQENIKTEIYCDACNKKFSTNGSLKRHHERNQVCKNWLSLEKPKVINFDMSIVEFIDNLKDKVTTRHGNNFICCKYCNTIYSSVGNLNKHYKTTVTCNRLAYIDFENEIKKI